MANMTPAQQDKKSQQDTEHLVNESKEAVSGAADKAKDFASNVGDKARDMASNVGDRARSFAHTSGQKASEMTKGIGCGMESLGESIREHTPHSGTAGAVASRVADTLEHGGRYLKEKELAGIAEDVADLIRRNPVPAILIGIGLGYLIARAVRR
jgi:ElaB/YqjD/DUF883 family membrane-anchored ribosome-binding protein